MTADGSSPVVRRRRLAAALRRLRAESGKTLEDVAEYLEFSATKISRIETGQVGVRVHDVRGLLDCYGVAGQQRDELLELVRLSRTKAWWHAYSDLLSEDVQTLIGLEDEAAHILSYETHHVPGLLQTEGYARALMTAGPDTPLENVERGVELRLRRQAILARSHPPQLHAILDQAALQRLAGRAEVMLAQLRHLIQEAAKPHITVQVLPLSAPAHPGDGFAFTILSFTNPADPKIAYTETLIAEYSTDNPELVGRCRAQFDYLLARALSPADSTRLIDGLISTLATGQPPLPAAAG